jgi:ribosomal protein S6--L-glutamate ligase
LKIITSFGKKRLSADRLKGVFILLAKLFLPLNLRQKAPDMIVSFHPTFEADKNIICAGRKPNAEDLEAIRAARAVILGQGCYRSLYEMARANCPNVFPNYDAKFKYPGKIGQIKLFRKIKAPHPSTAIYSDLAAFQKKYRHKPGNLPTRYPLVFKYDWGGEGETVYRIDSPVDLQKVLTQTAEFERSGQRGFLLQEFVPCDDRTLRVVVIGQQFFSYWRIQQNSGAFHTSLSKGAVIDSDAAPGLQQKAVAVVKDMCQKTGINLAGFDIISSSKLDDPATMLLEINYFFGRKGLGGSEAYYKILQEEIQAWLAEIS